MPETENTDPFLRVSSRSEKYSTLVMSASSTVFFVGIMFFLGAELQQPMTWMCGYGAAYFGIATFHSWTSIKNEWNIREENENFYGPRFAWIRSKWLFLALLLGCLQHTGGFNLRAV